jgi:hypothetical protein
VVGSVLYKQYNYHLKEDVLFYRTESVLENRERCRCTTRHFYTNEERRELHLTIYTPTPDLSVQLQRREIEPGQALAALCKSFENVLHQLSRQISEIA